MSAATLPLPPDVAERTVSALVSNQARRSPNRLALVAQSPLAGEARLTWAQVAHAMKRVAGNLVRAGVRPGEHVGILLSNAAGREAALSLLGLGRLGAVGVLLSPRMAAPELADAVRRTGCCALIAASESAASVASLDAAGALPPLLFGVGDIGVPARAWEDLLAPCPSPPEWAGEDTVFDIILTSGTTGQPKAVMLSHGNAVAAGLATARGLGFREADVMQTALPVTSSGGFHVCVLGILAAGGTAVVSPPFDAEGEFARISRERASVYVAVPSMYAFLLDRHDPKRHDTSSLRLMDFGAAPMAAETIKRLRRAFPAVELRQNYGMTESGPVGTYLSGRDMGRKLGSIGKPEMCEARIVGEDGSDVPPDEAGELWLRGPGVMVGYHGDEAATEGATAGGWLRTGDVVSRDADGFLWHRDRKKDVIKRGGYSIASMEVENALLRHPDVLEAAVIGVPHPKLGEDVFAFVVPRTGAPRPDAASVGEVCRGVIADYKVPRRIAVVEGLPRNPAGKILKTALRQDAARLLAEEDAR